MTPASLNNICGTLVNLPQPLNTKMADAPTTNGGGTGGGETGGSGTGGSGTGGSGTVISTGQIKFPDGSSGGPLFG